MQPATKTHRTALVILLICFLSLSSTVSATQQSCQRSMLDWWKEDVAYGQRAFVIDTGARDDGISFYCLSKSNSSNTLLDPAVMSSAHHGMFEQNSKMPCKVVQDLFGAGYIPAVAENSTSCDSADASSTCSYPLEGEGQESWGGPSFKVSMVNGLHTTEDPNNRGVAYESPHNNIYGGFTQGVPYGVENDVSVNGCRLETNQNQYLYTSSVVLSTTTLDNMKYKIYMFATDAERQAALNDNRNEGLQYATEMKGENGCDVELLYEFKPKTGGGLSINPSQSLNARTEAIKWNLLDYSSAYQSPSTQTATMLLKKQSLREAQGLPVRSVCDSGDTPTIKFSTQFVCKATGAGVNITTITYKNAERNVVALSADPNNPTFFQPNLPAISTAYHHENDPDLFLEVSATDAPESCDWMYWDPLMVATKGNGQGSGVGDELNEGIDWGKLVVFLILIPLIICCCCCGCACCIYYMCNGSANAAIQSEAGGKWADMPPSNMEMTTMNQVGSAPPPPPPGLPPPK